jgi:hypothetical protein
LHDQIKDPTAATAPSSPPAATPQAPDFTKGRRYFRTVQQPEALDQFIEAGWIPADLAEYARSMYLVPGQSKPTAASYQFVIEKGPDHEWANEALATMRTPGYIMPPFDRPESKRFAWDDPDNPEHAPELRADIAEWPGYGETVRQADTPSRGLRRTSRYHGGSGSVCSGSAIAITRLRILCSSKGCAGIANRTPMVTPA